MIQLYTSLVTKTSTWHLKLETEPECQKECFAHRRYAITAIDRGFLPSQCPKITSNQGFSMRIAIRSCKEFWLLWCLLDSSWSMAPKEVSPPQSFRPHQVPTWLDLPSSSWIWPELDFQKTKLIQWGGGKEWTLLGREREDWVLYWFIHLESSPLCRKEFN